MSTQPLDTATATSNTAPETYSPPHDKQQLAEVFDFLHAAKVAGREVQAPQYFLSGATSDQQIQLPAEVYRALEQVVDAMRRGMAVAVIPAGKTVTTQEAADLLGVSRPTIVKLIGRGELPHEMVGTHRRVPLDALLEYKRARREAQFAALAELAAADEPDPQEVIERARKARKKVAQRH